MTPATIAVARRSLGIGLLLAFLCSLFVDATVLTVPLYDMQLYDRVLQSRNMDTLAMLSLACAVGLLLYGVLDALRAGVFAVVADTVARKIQVPLLRDAVARTVRHGDAGGAEAVRDLALLHGFLSSGAPATLMDALCSPLLGAVLFLLHPAFGWLGCLGVALLVGLNLVTDALVRPGAAAAATLHTGAAMRLSSRLREPELLDGLGMLPAVAERWAAERGRAQAAALRADRRARSLAEVSKLLRLVLAGAVMVLGALLVLDHATTPGALMGANLLLNKMVGPFDHLIGGWRHWAAAQAAWGRISAGVAPAGPVGETLPSGQERGLVLQGVGFRDPGSGRAILSGIDLAVGPGSLVAVIGPNGSGKSTLLRLVAGLLPPDEGAVRLDGAPLWGGDGSRIGYLPQGVALLDGSIAENVARFRDDSIDAAVTAASAAGMHEAIGRLPRGYETPVTAAGGVSGGQAQRLGLARALYGGPRLVVLDEPDANLDHDGDTALLAALVGARAAGAVVVVTTHRARLLQAADITLTLEPAQAEPARREAA